MNAVNFKWMSHQLLNVHSTFEKYTLQAAWVHAGGGCRGSRNVWNKSWIRVSDVHDKGVYAA